MTMQHRRSLAVAFLAAFACAPALADDIRPASLTQAEPPVTQQPLADEKCIEKCDVESDKCMQAAGGDSGKVQVCDDKYSECLQACEGGG